MSPSSGAQTVGAARDAREHADAARQLWVYLQKWAGARTLLTCPYLERQEGA